MAAKWRKRVEQERTFLQRLEGCLKVLHFEKHMNIEKLANTTVHFGNRSGIDLIGRIGLPSSGTDAEWVDILYNVDSERIDEIKDGSADRYDLEKRFSDLIGIDYIYTDYSLGASLRYKQLLNTLIDAAAVKEFRLSGAETMKVRILETPDLNGVTMDPLACTIALPICMDPLKMMEVLLAQKNDLVSQYTQISRSQEDLDTLILAAKRKYRLRSLTWEPQVSISQLQSCVTALIRYSAQLNRMLEGQRVRIGQEYHMDPTDGTIHVRWDFMV